jgi:hypothetical protein
VERWFAATVRRRSRSPPSPGERPALASPRDALLSSSQGVAGPILVAVKKQSIAVALVVATVSACLFATVGLRLWVDHGQAVDMLAGRRDSISVGFITIRVVESVAFVAGIGTAVGANVTLRHEKALVATLAAWSAVAASVLDLEMTPARFPSQGMNLLRDYPRMLRNGGLLLCLATTLGLFVTGLLLQQLRQDLRRMKT